MEYTEVCNFADDMTPHSRGYNVNEVLTDIFQSSSILLEWFCDNGFMALNADICHLLVSGHKISTCLHPYLMKLYGKKMQSIHQEFWLILI